MKKRLKFRIFLWGLCVLPFLLCGCWDKAELNELAVVLGVGIDKGDAPDTISMTVQIEKSSGAKSSSASSSSSTAGSNYFNLTDTGNNVNTIFGDFSHQISRRLFISQNQVIILGNELAKEGIRNDMDFFLRNYQGRLTVNVFVAKGQAESILETDPLMGQIPAVEIPQLEGIQSSNSQSPELTVADLMTDLSSSTRSMVAPYIETVNDDKKNNLCISGSAVFKGDKLVGELDEKETRGYLWVDGKVKGGILNVSVLDGQAALRITNSSCKVVPAIRPNGSPAFRITVQESGILDSQTGSTPLFTQENLNTLQSAEAQAIRDEILTTFEKSVQLGTDIYGFGDMIKEHYPKEWKAMEPSWDELYRQLDIQVDVNAKVQGGGRISHPDYPEKELEK